MKRPARPRSLSDALVNRDRMYVRTVGRRHFTDVYHSLVGMTWPAFLATFATIFLGINGAFAALYVALPGALDGGPPLPAFARAFFFSVDTLSTVGYGNITPVTLAANLAATVEIACGFLLLAVTSGLMFARFARPSARILFSATVVVAEFDGAPHLMFRAANLRHNFILEASARLSVIRDERHEGQLLRRFHELPLVRASNPVFSLSWLVMHRIDAASPLHGLDFAGPEAADLELVVLLTGFDVTTSAQVHARHGWPFAALRPGHRFVDVIRRDEDGSRVIDYTRFHDTQPAGQDA